MTKQFDFWIQGSGIILSFTLAVFNLIMVILES